MAAQSIGDRATRGTLWVFIERLTLELFRFVTTLILARLLGPKEFGLVALTTIFFSISIAFIDSGFTKALIQKKITTAIDESTIFYFNLIISIFFVLIINIFSGVISNFFGEPRLENILRVLSITLILFALRQIQQVVLTKELNFKLQFKANVVGTLGSGILGIILAFMGYGVWALVAQAVFEGILKAIMFWYVSKWRPILIFSKQSFLEFYKFGLNLFFNDLLKSISENMYGLLIGKFYSPYNLGLYDRANKLASIVITNFQYSIQRVTFPVFALVQDDKNALRNTVKKSLDLILFLVIPSMVFLFVIAKPLVIVLLTVKWAPMVPYLKLFCIYWIFFPFSGVNNHLILALGHSKIILRQSFMIYGLQAILLIITLKMGMLAIIIGQIVASIGRQLILIYYARKFIDFGYRQQMSIFLGHFILAICAACIVYFFSFIIDNNYLLLFVQMLVGGLLYLGFSYIFNKKIIYLFIEQIQRLRHKK